MFKRPLLIINCILINMVFAVSSGANGGSIPLSGGRDVDLLRIFIIDISGSMDDEDLGANRSRLDTARVEIMDSIDKLPVSRKSPVVLIPFCDEVRDDLEMIYTDGKSLKKAVAELAPDGQTNITAGLKRATARAAQLGLCKNILLYLYSDGEHNVGSKDDLYRQERLLDKFFGQRKSKGLSQKVVVKRWGGVIGQLVAELEKSKNVDVIDAGELQLGTVTLVPSVKITDVRWHDIARSQARIDLQVTITKGNNYPLPGRTAVNIDCLAAGSRCLNNPVINISGPSQTKRFSLWIELDPASFNPTQSYKLDLNFAGPGQVMTNKGILIVVVNPKQLSCAMPTGQLRPIAEVTAKLFKQGKPEARRAYSCLAYGIAVICDDHASI